MAVRGLIIRHLVLPEGLAGTAEVMRFIARELSVHSYVNVMAQYRPENKADRYPELSRRITGEEYGEALRLALEAGAVPAGALVSQRMSNGYPPQADWPLAEADGGRDAGVGVHVAPGALGGGAGRREAERPSWSGHGRARTK